eukprot:CAMPEP_0206468686 /NCGR_PEP_ID=MMETSP0324_2-20121206/29794_1 /ASSEMBLY_ACC=CAM_ASM_000836 /TAXON_ID=2866 /ORGANISM="Crypthecodinium cohnii, Strain Seligo" /LENGTH=52 /DNA_ID=CAMNT_0053942225 /DNA_START=691 /DNA_END=849 /DNA_ORIENTATION=-
MASASRQPTSHQAGRVKDSTWETSAMASAATCHLLRLSVDRHMVVEEAVVDV